MFATDKKIRGYNQFDVMPKIMMIQDMYNDFNPVEIGTINIEYSIVSNENSAITHIYDGVRKWRLSNVNEIEGRRLQKFRFYTNTDIGKRCNVKICFDNCVGGFELPTDNEICTNEGITRWSWDVSNYNTAFTPIDAIVIEEAIKEAWNLGKDKEIIYFIPKNFGMRIQKCNFSIWVDNSVDELTMELYEIQEENGQYERKFIGTLLCNQKEDKKVYGYQLNCQLNMENVYYITISK